MENKRKNSLSCPEDYPQRALDLVQNLRTNLESESTIWNQGIMDSYSFSYEKLKVTVNGGLFLPTEVIISYDGERVLLASNNMNNDDFYTPGEEWESKFKTYSDLAKIAKENKDRAIDNLRKGIDELVQSR